MLKQLRGPNKTQNCYTMLDIYKEYISDKVYTDPYYVTFDEFRSICKEYNEAFMNKLIFESATMVIPYRLGHLLVSKKIPKVLCKATLSPDWELSRKYHKLISHSNDHTGGFKHRFTWTKKSCMVVNKEMYRLVLSRTNKRLLAKAIKSGDHDYTEL